jgi:hypothetical protein
MALIPAFILWNLAADNLEEFTQATAFCSNSLAGALSGGRKSDTRKAFLENLDKMKSLSGKIQLDLNKNKININLISEVNYIATSFDRIKTLCEVALEHHLYQDMIFSFSELKIFSKDIAETGLYKQDTLTLLPRDEDYLLELQYFLDKVFTQKDELRFSRVKGSRILEKSELNMAKIVSLGGVVQESLRRQKITASCNLSSESNIMTLAHKQITNNLTGKAPKSKAKYQESLANMKSAVDLLVNNGVEVPKAVK